MLKRFYILFFMFFSLVVTSDAVATEDTIDQAIFEAFGKDQSLSTETVSHTNHENQSPSEYNSTIDKAILGKADSDSSEQFVDLFILAFEILIFFAIIKWFWSYIKFGVLFVISLLIIGSWFIFKEVSFIGYIMNGVSAILLAYRFTKNNT